MTAFSAGSGDFPPPTLEMLPGAVVENVAIAGRGSRAPNVAVVKADGYGRGSYTVARAAPPLVLPTDCRGNGE